LEQGRVNGVAFDVALFTNLSRDHLDYHGDMEHYEAAKARLFTWQGLRAAVINTDDSVGQRMAAVAQSNDIEVIGYGFGVVPAGVSTYLQASDVDAAGAHTSFVLHQGESRFVVNSALVGDFNVMNLLGVLGVLSALGFGLEKTIPLCIDIAAAPGRMQRFGGANQPLAVVDFAHTPDALDKTLRALVPIAAQRGGQLICVFGCGGDRDPGKRPQMGALAAQLADTVWITSDNPRSEEPESIVQQIAVGAQSAQGTAQVHIEVERRHAIARAIATASDKDVVLIAGKGHEAYQEIKGVKHLYSDLTEVNSALTQWVRPA
jgi:UDP-N-acetylmuramoyl-L-alanyl-D-glutamate--2,6-diaminopimelate ligase